MKRDIDRFEKKIDKPIILSACWNWVGAKKPTGYGNFYLFGRYETAHRAAWILYYGDIPDGLIIMHKCDNPSCVNPNHLMLGTPKENMDDMYKKGRDKHGRITKEECKQMISLRNAGKKLKEIATIFRCSEANVSLIVRGLSRAP